MTKREGKSDQVTVLNSTLNRKYRRNLKGQIVSNDTLSSLSHLPDREDMFGSHKDLVDEVSHKNVSVLESPFFTSLFLLTVFIILQ